MICTPEQYTCTSINTPPTRFLHSGVYNIFIVYLYYENLTRDVISFIVICTGEKCRLEDNDKSHYMLPYLTVGPCTEVEGEVSPVEGPRLSLSLLAPYSQTQAGTGQADQTGLKHQTSDRQQKPRKD